MARVAAPQPAPRANGMHYIIAAAVLALAATAASITYAAQRLPAAPGEKARYYALGVYMGERRDGVSGGRYAMFGFNDREGLHAEGEIPLREGEAPGMEEGSAAGLLVRELGGFGFTEYELKIAGGGHGGMPAWTVLASAGMYLLAVTALVLVAAGALR